MWVQLNAFHGSVGAIGEEDILPRQLPRTCAVIRAGCLAQIGIADGTLFRDEGYQFFRLGLLVERADQTSRLLDVKFAQGATTSRSVDQSDEFVFWSTILRTAAAYQVFHRLEPSRADPERVARFLILNPSHPRSIGFCVREINESLQILRSSFRLAKASKCLETCEVLMDGLQTAAREASLSVRLHQFNDWVQRSLYDLTDTIREAFFKVRANQPRADADEAARQPQSQTGGQGTQKQ